jgi:ABC-type Fe3+/spermidine/putrescine transport system ATPase subunit
MPDQQPFLERSPRTPDLIETNEPRLKIENLVRHYSKDAVVGPISFSVADGEFFSLLGPSGCGKTTTLRCIAGFETADSGAIHLSGQRIEKVPPHKRGVGLVFQTPTLFPHLTVAKNVAFGLEAHNIGKSEIARRVQAALELIDLPTIGERMPHQLSGGQQQRVALARSLVLEPSVLLLDEPLSSLDLKLRVQMRAELRNLQRRLRKTTIFVTHDQTEALTLSDRIAVLSQGRIEQIGTPEEIYSAPSSRFVADFIGSSNLLEARVVGFSDSLVELVTKTGLHIKAKTAIRPSSAHVTALIRPERISLGPGVGDASDPVNTYSAEINDMVFLGEDIQYRVLADRLESLLVVRKSGEADAPAVGQANVRLQINPTDVYLLAK